MTLITTVAILDSGTCKHQCVTMRTKDFFREYLFFKRLLCIKIVVKDLLQNQAHF
jgi:hypothetical protein